MKRCSWLSSEASPLNRIIFTTFQGERKKNQKQGQIQLCWSVRGGCRRTLLFQPLAAQRVGQQNLCVLLNEGRWFCFYADCLSGRMKTLPSVLYPSPPVSSNRSWARLEMKKTWKTSWAISTAQRPPRGLPGPTSAKMLTGEIHQSTCLYKETDKNKWCGMMLPSVQTSHSSALWVC